MDNTAMISVLLRKNTSTGAFEMILMMWWWITSTLWHVLGTSDALSFNAGTRLTGQLTCRVLVGTGGTLDTLLLLPAVERPHTTAYWRRTAQVSTDWILSVAPHYDRRTGHQHDTSWHEARLTALSFSEDLSRAAGLGTLRYSGRFLGHLILRPRELDVELLFVDRLPESPHSALQLLLHLLPHTVQVTWVWGKRWPLINSIKEYYKILTMSLVFL